VTSAVLERPEARELLAQTACEELARRGDPRWWIQRNLFIRTKDRQVIPLQFNEAQLRYYDERTDRDIILKPRQLGFTTQICGLFFADTILNPNTSSVMMAHDRDSTELIFRIVQLFWERLDPEAQALAGKPRFANRREYFWPEINSRFFVSTAGAEDFGRGQTINNLHCSELAFWSNAAQTLSSLLQAVPAGGRVVMESTPNGMGNEFHARWSQAQERIGGYTPHFWRWPEEPTYRIDGAANHPQIAQMAQRTAGGNDIGRITVEEAVAAQRLDLDEGQLRWRRAKQAELGRRFLQEYPEDDLSCFLQSGHAFFNVARALELAQREKRPPIAIEDDGRLLLWAQPVPGRAYCIAADVAKGIVEQQEVGDPEEERGGADYSTAIVTDWETGEQVAEWHGRLREFLFAHVLFALWKRYPGLIAPERNGPGETVCQRLIELDPSCVYYEPSDRRAGWVNNLASRVQALNLLARSLEQGTLLMRSAGFWREVQVFATHERTGKPEAEPGYHDDRVMAKAIDLLVRQKQAAPNVSGKAAKPLPAALPFYDPLARSKAESRESRSRRGRQGNRR